MIATPPPIDRKSESVELAGWGRYPRHYSHLVKPTKLTEVPGLTLGESGLIARGYGRAYGDAAIGKRSTVSMCSLDRIRTFDREIGQITAEAGLLLSDLLSLCMPLGYFPPVVPGTKFVTLGGMAASDVHGKNHHRDGGFGDHLQRMSVLLPDGRTESCSPHENAELFTATIGGMGLTGIILDLTFTLNRIETGWLKQTTHVAPNLESALQVLGSVSASTYSVAWIDCLARGASLGRSLIFAAEHATPNELRSSRQEFPKRRASRLSVPFDLPEFTLNRASIRAFNELYYRVGAAKAKTPQLVQWDPYFFPLDAIGSWNRIYGRRGFVQYQCVIPTARAVEVLTEILERVSTRSSASFLAVLKQLRAGRGFLSFPLEGYTLALDLAVDEKVFFLLDELDRLVVAAGGRLYLAKDARQSAATFEASYPDLDRFRDLRRAIGAERHMSSFMSNRLGMR